MANSADPYQTAPIGSVCSGSTLFASIPNLSVIWHSDTVKDNKDLDKAKTSLR